MMSYKVHCESEVILMLPSRYEGERVLVLAPHADDETLGCGGIIQKYIAAGSPVRIVVATFVTVDYHRYRKESEAYVTYSGIDRLKELHDALAILGVTDLHFLYVDSVHPPEYHSRLDTVSRYDLASSIEHHIQDFHPTVMFLPSRTKHQDHVALHDAGVTAGRPYFWSGSIGVYETDGELEFRPNLYVSLTKEQVEKKAKALAAYQTQVGPLRHPVNPELVIAKARFRGQAIYEDYAEAFELIRVHG